MRHHLMSANNVQNAIKKTSPLAHVFVEICSSALDGAATGIGFSITLLVVSVPVAQL
jgi:hypothetical protein